MMLNEFKPGELPGGDIKGASEDITNYAIIEEISRTLVRNCVMERKMYGWMQTGMTYELFHLLVIGVLLEHYPEFAAF